MSMVGELTLQRCSFRAVNHAGVLRFISLPKNTRTINYKNRHNPSCIEPYSRRPPSRRSKYPSIMHVALKVSVSERPLRPKACRILIHGPSAPYHEPPKPPNGSYFYTLGHKVCIRCILAAVPGAHQHVDGLLGSSEGLWGVCYFTYFWGPGRDTAVSSEPPFVRHSAASRRSI